MKKSWYDSLLGMILPESAKVILGYDVWDIDKHFIFFICLVFYCIFLGCGIAIGYTQYQAIVTQKFISLDSSSGICVEVPRGLNSDYEADDVGYWSTHGKFKYQRSLYAVSTKSLQMTTAQWTAAMSSIIKQVKTVTEKGKFRDYAWNMVMWASFSTTVQAPDRLDEIINRVQPGGSLQFYANADSDILFGDREIIGVNFGNKNGICAPSSNIAGYYHLYIINFIHITW